MTSSEKVIVTVKGSFVGCAASLVINNTVGAVVSSVLFVTPWRTRAAALFPDGLFACLIALFHGV